MLCYPAVSNSLTFHMDRFNQSNSYIASASFLYQSSFVSSSKHLTRSNLTRSGLFWITVLGDLFYFNVEFMVTQICNSKRIILSKKREFWSWTGFLLFLSVYSNNFDDGMVLQAFRMSFLLSVNIFWKCAYRHTQRFAFLLLHTSISAYTCIHRHMQYMYTLHIYSATYTHNHHTYWWNSNVCS